MQSFREFIAIDLEPSTLYWNMLISPQRDRLLLETFVSQDSYTL